MTPHSWLKRTALLLTLLLAPTVAADDKDKKADKDDPFAAYAKLSQPGPEHKILNVFDGNWTFTAKFWLDPSKPPSESKGTASRKWMMDRRFQADEIKGEFMGQPFSGFGLTGYDKAQKKYVGTWIDSMSTGISQSTGTYDQASKTFTFHREDFDPVEKKKLKGRDVVKVESNDRHVMEMYKEGPDGKDIKVMELVFTRVKK